MLGVILDFIVQGCGFYISNTAHLKSSLFPISMLPAIVSLLDTEISP